MTHTLPPVAGSLLSRLHIRRAVPDDIPACDRIARAWPQDLGWVRRAGLEEAQARGTLLVAAVDDTVRGFVEYRTRQDGISTVYTLAVQAGWRGLDLGRHLLYAVPHPVRLKCPADSAANRFYKASGMQLISTEQGRKRPLNVWLRRIMCLWIQGNNRDIPPLCRLAGMGYGTRHDMRPMDYAHMIDIHWSDYDWSDYLAKVRCWRPARAMVADYERPDQRELMLQQVADLRALGVLHILVCPKFPVAVADIPADCVIAISVPSQYAGYVPDPAEVGGRAVHLLGGSPQKQIALMRAFNVVSIDGNAHDAAAKFESEFRGGVWSRPLKQVKKMTQARMNHVRLLSAREIVRAVEAAAAHEQISLWN